MTVELLVNASAREVRVATLVDGVLEDLALEHASRRGLTGNLYRGRVARVLPGMQAAFVEIGLARTAFLHADDLATRGPPGLAQRADIRGLVREGDAVLVQVLKEPLGTKGARLTAHLAIPSRYLVLLPGDPTIGISGRITDEAERERLRALVVAGRGDAPDGYIVRTAAEGVDGDALRADQDLLARLWASIRQRAAVAPVPSLVHADPALEIRALRDLPPGIIDRVVVDSGAVATRMREFAGQLLPGLADRIEVCTDPRPLFDRLGIEAEIARLLERRVELRSGGYLVIDQTEAMTTVDVNTGGYVGHRDQEDTIFRTNLEAATALARQLRLRNLGGIVIVDFIDMAEPGHREQVVAALAAAVAGDPGRPQLADVSPLGLVAMTRKRTRDSLGHLLCRPCPACHGTGQVKTPVAVCAEIFRAVRRLGRDAGHRECVVLAGREVIDCLLGDEAAGLAEVSDGLPRPVRLQAEAQFGPDQFDVVLV
jgi:ribonuclease G